MTVWPTLPARSANNFLDHFSGASLNARWTAVTSGTGAVTVTDSYAKLSIPANSASFIYYNTKLNQAVSQLWTACLSMESDSAAGFDPRMAYLVNGSGAPAGDTKANIDGKRLVDWTFNAAGSKIVHTYTNSGGSSFDWSDSSQAWVASAGVAGTTPVELSDYYILGIELDGQNRRWRTFWWCRNFATAGTYTFDQGWRLFEITDWVTWASTRSNADVWFLLGSMYTDSATVAEIRVEWVRYAEAVAGNSVIDAWAADKSSTTSANHRIRHYSSYDGLTFLPDDRTSWALDIGTSGTYDGQELEEPRCVYDGEATDYMFYTGTNNFDQVNSIAVAYTQHASPQTGVWTKYASNPVLSRGAAGADDESNVGFCDVIRDPNDSDANKRWKMLYSGQKASDSKWRTLYATAPAAIGPWTKQGTVIDVGGAGANDEKWARNPIIVRYNNVWEVWYEGRNTSDVTAWLRATGTSLGSLTKDGSSYSRAVPNASQDLTANLSTAPGRTVTIGDTSNYVVDAGVVLSQSTDRDTWSYSKIRKIVSSTQLELYHGVTGFTTVYPARIKQTDASPNSSMRAIVQVGSEWWFYTVIWGIFDAEANYESLVEEMFLFSHSNAAPSGATATIQYQPSPVIPRGYNNDLRSVENMTLRYDPLPYETAVMWWKA